MQHHARVQHKSRKRASVDERDLCSSKHSTTRFVVLYDDVGLELSGRIPGTIDYRILHLCVRNQCTRAIPLCHAAPTPRSAGRPPGPSPPRLRLLTASGVRPEAVASEPARVRRRPRAVRPALDRASSARRPCVTLHPRHADVAPARALAAPG